MDGGLTKVIVFSQFWMHMWLVKNHLSRHNVAFALLRAGITAAEKAHELDLFQVETCYSSSRKGVLLVVTANYTAIMLRSLVRKEGVQISHHGSFSLHHYDC